MLAELTLHSDLDQITLEQNSIVLTDEPDTLRPPRLQVLLGTVVLMQVLEWQISSCTMSLACRKFSTWQLHQLKLKE